MHDMTENVTLECTVDAFTLCVTQQYLPARNRGHYHYYIKKDGHIVVATGTIGSAPIGKMDEHKARAILVDYINQDW